MLPACQAWLPRDYRMSTVFLFYHQLYLARGQRRARERELTMELCKGTKGLLSWSLLLFVLECIFGQFLRPHVGWASPVTGHRHDGRSAKVATSTVGRAVFQDHALLGRERLIIYIPLPVSMVSPASSVRSCRGRATGDLVALLLVVVVAGCWLERETSITTQLHRGINHG